MRTVCDNVAIVLGDTNPTVAVFDNPRLAQAEFRCNLRVYGVDRSTVDFYGPDRETLAEQLEWLAEQVRAGINEAAA